MRHLVNMVHLDLQDVFDRSGKISPSLSQTQLNHGTESVRKVQDVVLFLCIPSDRHVSCGRKEISEVSMIEPPPGIFSFLNAKLQLCI